ncbi:MAG TPA: hypothetical protein DGH68_02265 [Bacteroidetes bacterium]|nr:hypothetical protein [Bacteroidota bacterium]
MTFLNPFLLFGLAAAAIPIIIHLLSLRKLKTIEFSSLQFLKELQKTKMRRVRIRQILLLVLRTLLIILIVLAFARPALRGTVGTIGAYAKSTVVIILDDSPSMAVRDERGVLFNQAATAVSNLLNLVKEGDELYFLRLSETRHSELPPATSVSLVKGVLSKVAPSLETVSFRDALGAASKVLTESKNFNQEIYLVTDAQTTQFLSTATKDSADLFDDRVKVFFVEAGKQQDNAGVVSLDIKTRIILQGKPVGMKATVRNFGNTPMRNSLLSVYVDGSRVMQHSLDIEARGSGTAEFSITPKRRGFLQGYAQLEDDALETDNRRYFAFNVPEKINVLMIGGKPQDTRLAFLALTLGGDSSLAGLFTTVQATQEQLSSLDINKFNVLVFCGVKAFTATESDRIAQFVKAGGGMMMFPGDESNVVNWNETILAKLGIPASEPAHGETPGTDQSSFLSFEKVDYSHPLFEGLFEQPTPGKESQATIESPRVYKAIKPRVGENGRTIIGLSDGSSFFTEYSAGMGHVLLFSVEANIGWSDFPVKGLFAPLLHRSIVYLAGGEQSATSGIAGENIKAAVRTKTPAGKGSYVFRSPAGIEERTVPHANMTSGLSLFESSATTEAGVYELRNGNETLHASAVNIDPEESDLRHATDEELASFWKRVGVNDDQARRLRTSDNLETTILEARLGVELWKYLVLLAVIIALIEMAVAREAKPAAKVEVNT